MSNSLCPGELAESNGPSRKARVQLTTRSSRGAKATRNHEHLEEKKSVDTRRIPKGRPEISEFAEKSQGVLDPVSPELCTVGATWRRTGVGFAAGKVQ
jgi:hypothetical protein